MSVYSIRPNIYTSRWRYQVERLMIACDLLKSSGGASTEAESVADSGESETYSYLRYDAICPYIVICCVQFP